MALHLTKRICETAAATGKGWSTLWDADVRGLGLRVRRSGRRVFVLFYRNQRCEKRSRWAAFRSSPWTRRAASRRRRSPRS
jgi:hypothetical protein